MKSNFSCSDISSDCNPTFGKILHHILGIWFSIMYGANLPNFFLVDGRYVKNMLLKILDPKTSESIFAEGVLLEAYKEKCPENPTFCKILTIVWASGSP